MDISVDLCGVELRNPTVLASGILGVTKASLRNVADNGAGAVTIKSISREPRKGHNSPIVITYEAGMMNAVGYSNPGLVDVGVPVIASIIGTEPQDFAYMARHFVTGEFAAVEVPLSCPHTPGFGMLAGQGTPEATSEITKAVKANTQLPVIIKLSPSIQNLAEVAEAAERAGADALNMGNTHGPGMVINVETRSPVLDFGVGGISGPAIRPIAMRCVYDLYKAVKIPIIGTGGITNWRDAVEFLMAGATAIGIGSAVHYDSIGVFGKICDGVRKFMREHDYASIAEVTGAAHD
jgi:dihydroorotate dehydrogenase (NAD+) catalytic subunit